MEAMEAARDIVATEAEPEIAVAPRIKGAGAPAIRQPQGEFQ